MMGGGCIWPVGDEGDLCRDIVVGEHKLCRRHLHKLYPPPGSDEDPEANLQIINEVIRKLNDQLNSLG